MPDHKSRFLIALVAATAFHAAAAPAATDFSDALAKGKISLSLRLRDEYADQSNLAHANALTLRTALGFTSAPYAGFQAMVEAENIASLGERDDYNAAGTNPGGAGRTSIGDPTGTGLNQAWLAYARDPFALKVGRQRLVLDNARFVGDSGWRQNAQTFDAAALTANPAKNVSLNYDYVWRVSRVFGNRPPQPDFRSDSHLFNASYGGWSRGRFTAYAYLLDFKNSAANSSDTFGASFSGAAPVNAELKLSYRAEIATQQAAGRNSVDYRATYSLLELGVAMKSLTLGAGHEVLGSDAGLKGFATPLATLHAFNGWADLFNATPARGLRDRYVSAGVTLPGALPLKVVYHDYLSDQGAQPYGREWNVLLSRKIGKQWTVLAKGARFEGVEAFPDVTRLWLQVEFSL